MCLIDVEADEHTSALLLLCFCTLSPPSRCRETLRRDPVVTGLQRVAAKDFQLSGYKVPKGKLLMLPLKYVGAHDARFEQDNPDVFMPERMLTAEAQKKGDQMPFGYGPRYCGWLMGVGVQHAVGEMPAVCRDVYILCVRFWALVCTTAACWCETHLPLSRVAEECRVWGSPCRMICWCFLQTVACWHHKAQCKHSVV
jgi:hypothetical protein